MYCRSKYIKVSIKYLAKRTFKVSSGVGMVFIKGRKDILWVLKPAFKEQIWILRLENAQIANLSLISAICVAKKLELPYKSAQNRKQGFETAGNAQEASG